MKTINLLQTTILTIAICAIFTWINYGGKVTASTPGPVEIVSGSFTVSDEVSGTEYVMTGDGTITFPECVTGRHFSVMNKHDGNIIADAGYGGAIFVWNASLDSPRAERTVQNVDQNSVTEFLCIGDNSWRAFSNGTWNEPE